MAVHIVDAVRLAADGRRVTHVRWAPVWLLSNHTPVLVDAPRIAAVGEVMTVLQAGDRVWSVCPSPSGRVLGQRLWVTPGGDSLETREPALPGRSLFDLPRC